MISINDVQMYLATNGSLRKALDLPDTPLEVSLFARGGCNENFLFLHPITSQVLLFRVNLDSQLHLENQVSYEARALALLEPCGHVPHVYYVDDSKDFLGKGLLIEEFLPGRSLDYTCDLPKAAAILADIHSVFVPTDHGLVEPPNPFRDMVDECNSMFCCYRTWSGSSPQVCRQIGRWFQKASVWADDSACTAQRHIISTELNAANFLINESAQSYLVDWEKPLFGEVEQDLAHFLVPTTTYWRSNCIFDNQDVGNFLTLYRKEVDDRFDTSRLEENLWLYCALTCLRGVTWCAKVLAQHETNERRVDDDDTLEKIKVYLGQEFLTNIEERYYR